MLPSTRAREIACTAAGLAIPIGSAVRFIKGFKLSAIVAATVAVVNAFSHLTQLLPPFLPSTPGVLVAASRRPLKPVRGYPDVLHRLGAIACLAGVEVDRLDRGQGLLLDLGCPPGFDRIEGGWIACEADGGLDLRFDPSDVVSSGQELPAAPRLWLELRDQGSRRPGLGFSGTR